MKDKPKPPKGPLETNNITAEGCDLKWKAPEVQEGVPVKAYIIEVQEGRSGNWQKIGETKGTEFKVNFNNTEFRKSCKLIFCSLF